MNKLFLFFCCIMLTACVSTPVINQANLSDVDFDALQYQKMGVACDNIVFFIIPLERHASVAKAAFKAGIKKVSYVETYHVNLYPLIYKHCVIVYGE